MMITIATIYQVPMVCNLFKNAFLCSSQEHSATTKDLKMKMVAPIISTLNSPVLSVHRSGGPWRMTGHYHRVIKWQGES